MFIIPVKIYMPTARPEEKLILIKNTEPFAAIGAGKEER